MTSDQIRQHFLDFFVSKKHTIVPSSPIVVKDDPTLLFTNAGMNQFKDYFLGNRKPPYTRVADTQKCLRVSGKHNDLEEVGVDTYHHTMFEMLGNWSFGDYFKEEAIAWSWELLTKVYGIPEDLLYVTVFEGDDKEQLPKDEEAITFWKKWLPEERIIMGNKKDNFWEMGDTGPCGPCTEIHVDCRTVEERNRKSGKDLVNNDDPQVIEIWNNVFIQFNRKKDGSLEPLPSKHVDTGMGFERLVRVLQQKQSNYDTDVFTGTIAEVEKISGRTYQHSDTREDIAFRVIADHIRAIAFPVSDGQLPSNTGAGYVIRRILRRAVRYYYSYLGVKQPLLYKLVPLIAEQFKHVFPGLATQADFVGRVIHEEESNFLKTLDKGLKRIEEIIKSGNANGNIDGAIAFELYDTYGFPLDLTKLIAAENAMQVDEPGFTEHMHQQKTRSRSASAVDAGDWIIVNESGNSTFVGYDKFKTTTRLLKYRKTITKNKESFQLVLEQTPFYAESGGQVGDKGKLVFDGETIEVTDTKKDNDLTIHYSDTLPSTTDAPVIASIDAGRRSHTQVHHSATHLMHAALRNILGVHVAQKGSLVNDEYLRFDFSHFAKLTDEEIRKVEDLVNEKIRENIPVIIKELPKEEAIALGAMALFGEKYGDVVRVVIMDPSYSIELCGGTHVGSTGELGLFMIKNETAIGAGTRRIEAVCGQAAESFMRTQLDELKAVKQLLKNPKDVLKSISQVMTEKELLSRSMEKMEAKELVAIKAELLEKATLLNDINFIGEIIGINSAEALRKLTLSLKDLPGHVIVLGAAIEDKAFVTVMVDEKVISSTGTDALSIIKNNIAPLIKGGGGGQKTMASAGGQDTSKLGEAIENTRALFTKAPVA